MKKRKKKQKKEKKRKKTIPIESEIQRRKEFELFAEWLALSPLLKLLQEDQLKAIGVDDPTEIELLSIKTQGDFAKKFKLSPDTLSNWKKKDELWDLVDEYLKEWGARKTPSVLLGFYKKAVSEGDAARVRLWLQYFKGWVEKSKIEHGGKITTEIEQKIRIDPTLKKAIEFYEKQLKKEYRGGDSGGKHTSMDKKRKHKKRKRRTD